MKILYADSETGADISLPEVGVFAYAERAHIQLMAWAIDDGPVRVDEWNASAKANFAGLIGQVDRVVFHHAEFDTTLLAADKVEIPREKLFCTMNQARRHGLPGGLGKLCEVFNIPEDKAKQKAGRALMMLFCKPNADGTWNTPSTHPEQWAAYKKYCEFDVIAMRELYRIMPHWNDAIEAPIEYLSDRINARGFEVDAQFAAQAVKLLTKYKDDTDSDVHEVTNGQVEKGTQRDRILKWILAEHGVDLPDLTKSTLERRLGDENLPDAVRELIALRLQSNKASTAKYAAVLKRVSNDGRMRGAFAYCGAARTGRFASYGLQVHNLKRPDLPAKDIEHVTRAIRAEAFDLLY